LPVIGKKAGDIVEKEINKTARNVQKSLFKKLDDNFKQKLEMLKSNPNSKLNFEDVYQEALNELDEVVGLQPGVKETIQKELEQKFSKQVSKTLKNAKVRKIIEDKNQLEGSVIEKQKVTQKPGFETGELVPGQITEEVLMAAGGNPFKRSTSIAQDLEVPRVPIEDMSPEDAAVFVRRLQEGAFGTRISDPARSGIYKNIAKKSSDMIEEAFPDTAPLNKESTAAYRAMDELGIDAAEKGLEQPKVSSFIERMSKEGAASRVKERTASKQLRAALGEQEGSRLMKEMKDRALDASIVRGASKEKAVGTFKDVLLSPRAMAAQTANIAAKLSKAPIVTKTSRAMSLANKLMQNTSKESYDALANFMQKNNRPEVAAKLREVAGSPQTKKNAAIFTMLQNPNERAALEEAQAEIDTQQDESTEE
jgi:hypothetical protein